MIWPMKWIASDLGEILVFLALPLCSIIFTFAGGDDFQRAIR
jgi:hypothetical protein